MYCLRRFLTTITTLGCTPLSNWRLAQLVNTALGSRYHDRFIDEFRLLQHKPQSAHVNWGLIKERLLNFAWIGCPGESPVKVGEISRAKLLQGDTLAQTPTRMEHFRRVESRMLPVSHT